MHEHKTCSLYISVLKKNPDQREYFVLSILNDISTRHFYSTSFCKVSIKECLMTGFKHTLFFGFFTVGNENSTKEGRM